MNTSTYKFLSTMFFLLIGSMCYSQHTEIRANAYTGFFFFCGSGATSTSTVHVDDVIDYFNPTSYGKKSGASYSLEIQGQRVTRQKHVFGLGLAYENLESKAVVDSFSSDIGTRPVSGNVFMENTFITINPYIGQRFSVHDITFDALVGIDLSFSAKVLEKAKVTS